MNIPPPMRRWAAPLGVSFLRPSIAVWIVLGLLFPIALSGQINVLTNRYDPQRTGANLSETTLRPANVNVNQFGKLYSYPVDGAVNAQPLYVTGVVINGSPHNVLYVGTMNDKMYAFDADSALPSPLWMRDFTNPPSVTAVPITDIAAPNLNIIGNVGVESTPVIDQASGALYLIARTKENGKYVQRLHSLDITTGLERSGSPVTITGSVPGTAPDSIDGGASGRVIPFDPKMQNQRAGLALSNGVVLVAWGSHEDITPYHGWVMGFDAYYAGACGYLRGHPGCVHGRNLAGKSRAGDRRGGERLFCNRQWQLGRHTQLRRFSFEVQREPDGFGSDRLFHPRQRSPTQSRR